MDSGRFVSGPGEALYGLSALDDAEENGLSYVKSKGVQSITELREPAAVGADLGNSSSGSGNTSNSASFRFGPALDGWFLPKEWPGPDFGEARQDRPIPVLAGLTADEGSASPSYGKTTRDEFVKAASERFGSLADEFLGLYPVTDDSTAGEVMKQATRERLRVGTYSWARRRVALTALYVSTDGDNWLNNANWRQSPEVFNIPGTECTWYGVTCASDESTVLQLRLGSNWLTGSIPPELGNLVNLETLILAATPSLSGTIPPPSWATWPTSRNWISPGTT